MQCMGGKSKRTARRGRKKRKKEGMHGRKEQKNCEKGTEKGKDGGNAWEERAKEL